MRLQPALLGLLVEAYVALACDIPGNTLSNTITQPFGLLIQNPAFPVIHDRYMNLNPAGGGDYHPYLSPAGNSAFDLTLNQGVVTQNTNHLVVSIQSTASDNTSKIFWTDRSNAMALFQPVYGCNPDNDSLQIQLKFLGGEGMAPGGKVCVRSASGNRYEFRYSPPGNPVVDPKNPCMEVTMALVNASGGGVTSAATTLTTSTTSSSSSSSTTSSTTTTTSQSTTTTSTTPTSTPTSGPLPYTDMTAKGFAFIGCSPEARKANDGLGRTLTGASLAQDAMTNEVCLDFCTARGYAYAGTEYRRECYCGNTVAATRQPQTTVASLKDCKLTCMGNTAEYCGGQSWLSLYKACPVGGPCVNANFT